MKLLLFNPETEYALATGASFYTPPASVEKLRKEQQLLPEAWATEEDLILVDDMNGLISKNKLVNWNSLSEVFSEYPDLIIEPWGWNAALVRKFLDHGVHPSKLPDEETVVRIRRLAHRRTTICLINQWNEFAEEGHKIDVPIELTSIEECMDFYLQNEGCWLKAPWSSSGRGVINTACDMTAELVEQWCRGILRRQGSVLGETAADRMSDYATEWSIIDGKAIYLGLSSFSTSNRGKYISNQRMSQSLMTQKFNSESILSIDDVVELQKKIIQKVFSDYEGPLGVDMIIERSGKLRPFVEVNVRHTMGMLHIIP